MKKRIKGVMEYYGIYLHAFLIFTYQVTKD